MTAVAAPTGNVTLVFANVQGATELWDRASVSMRSASEVYNDVLRAGLEKYQGYEVKSEGDTFMMAFANAMDAVKWCLKIQEQLVQIVWPEEILAQSFGAEVTTETGALIFRGLRVRMGVHSGNPTCTADPITARMDYFGPMVNRTARIANAGHGGQILLSAEVLQSDDRLDVIKFFDLGVYRLRGVQESGRLFQIQPESLSERVFPPLRALGAHRSNLPHQPNVFVGREKSLDWLTHLFNEGHEAVTLVGQGGIGKSRLAIKYGAYQLKHYPGGVWYVDASHHTTLGEFLISLAQVLSISLNDAITPILQQEILGDAIRDYGRILIVLDNFEELIESAEDTLDGWMQHAPFAHFLVTSRVRFSYLDGAVYQVLPMSEKDGLRVFDQVAKSRSHSFRMNEKTQKEIAEIVHRLDGVPLAIELAASRINILTPAKILERLSKRFQLLQSRDAHVGQRQRTLKATIDWSWDLLEPWEKAILAQSSVFKGGFDLKALKTVADVTQFGRIPSMVQIAQRLVDENFWKSQVMWQGYTRYSLYESIRDYAGIQLKQNPEEAPQSTFQVKQRHADYYRQFGKQEHLNSFSMKGGVRRRQKLVLELENLQISMKFALSEGQSNDAALFALGAMQIYSEQGPFSRAIELADVILKLGDLSPQLKIRMLVQQARAHRWAAHSEDAKVKLELALESAMNVDDQKSEGVVLTQLGEMNTHLGLIEEAESNCRRALLLHRKHQNRLQEGLTMGLLGLIYRFHHRLEKKERFQEAQQYFEGALFIHKQIGNRAAEGWAHRALGDLFMDYGYRDEGRQNYEAGLHILREVGQRFDEAITMGNLGIYFLEELNLENAKEYLEGSVALSKELQINAAGYFMCGLAEVVARLGDVERALELIAKGEKIVCQKESDDRLKGLVYCYRGQVMRCANDMNAAQTALEDAHSISAKISKGAQFELLQSIARLESDFSTTERSSE